MSPFKRTTRPRRSLKGQARRFRDLCLTPDLANIWNILTIAKSGGIDINLISSLGGDFLKLDQFRDVVAIAECGSMRAAARHLHVPQPILARNLRNLEREIGGKLFERRVRGMTPTPVGDIMIEGARRVLDEIRRISGSLALIRASAREQKDAELSVKAEPDENRTDHVFTDLGLRRSGSMGGSSLMAIA